MNIIDELAKGKGSLKFYASVKMPDGLHRCACIATIRCRAMEAESVSTKFVLDNERIVTHVEFCADRICL